MPVDHVLYKSFYLVDRHPGRRQHRGFFEAMAVDERLAVVYSANDLAGALDKDDYGSYRFNVEAGGDATREWAARLGINLVMYALCLDYKADQVHIPFILQRRR